VTAQRAGLVAALVVVSLAGCGGEERVPPADEDGPQAAALRVFRLSETDLDDPQSAMQVAGTIDVRDRDIPTLLDALETLRGVEHVRVVEAEALEEPGHWIVDIEGELPGPSLAEFSVEVVETLEGWRAVWFHGPGIEWPRRAARRDTSLTTSHPPDAPD
jgi:hypothetical protein